MPGNMGDLAVNHARCQISDFCLTPSPSQEDVVVGEVAVDDVVAVQVVQDQGNMVGDVDLDVVGEGGRRSRQEPHQALLHQLHQEDGSAAAGILDHSEELDDVSGPAGCHTPGGSEQQSPRPPGHRLGRRGCGGSWWHRKVVQHGFDDTPVGAGPKDFDVWTSTFW